jgi:twinkle protein
VLECLNKLIIFLDKYRVHGFLVAHPTKLKKDLGTKKYEVPTLYSISGSAHFFNRTHNGMSVWRDFETGEVDVHIQKIKWSWLGRIGVCKFMFDTMTRRYKAI